MLSVSEGKMGFAIVDLSSDSSCPACYRNPTFSGARHAKLCHEKHQCSPVWDLQLCLETSAWNLSGLVCLCFCRNLWALIPGGGGAQAVPQTSFRGFPVLQAGVGSANTTSRPPLSSNSPGARLRMILTIQSPMWFYRDNLFLLICWVCPPPPFFISPHVFRPAIISACRLLLTEAGSTQHWLLAVLRAAFALDIFAHVS